MHQSRQINVYRAAIISLIIILLIPIPVIFNHLDRVYEYIGLVVYALFVLGLGVGVVFLGEEFYSRAVTPIRWLQQHWVLLVLVLWGLLELWYLQQAFLATFRKHEKMLLLLTWTLLLVWLALILLFAGRSREAIKELVGKLLIGGISLFLSIFALGIGLAMVDYGNYQEAHRSWWETFEPDPLLGWRHPPNSKIGPVSNPSVIDEIEREIYYETDDLGLRNDGPRSGAPIAAVGDSFTFGVFVENEDTWVYQVGEQLGVRTANYGTGAYFMQHYNTVLKAYVCQEDHQIVLYAVYANDLPYNNVGEGFLEDYYRNVKLYSYRTPLHFGATVLFEQSPLHHLLNAIRNSSQQPAATEKPSPEIRIAPNGLWLAPSRIGLEMASLDSYLLAAESKLQNGITTAHNCGLEFVFVPIPTAEAVYADTFRSLYPEAGADEEILVIEEVYQHMCDVAESQGAFCYNMLDDMRTLADPDGEPLYFKVDGHLNARGNQATADLITAYLQEQNLFDEE